MTFKHIAGVKVIAIFSDCGKFRYQLEISKPCNSVGRTVCVILQNPSHANESVADKSVVFLENLVFEKSKEFQDVNRLLLVNQFAYIQTKNFEGGEDKIGKGNDEIIEKCLDSAQIVIIGWGKTNRYEERKREILRMIEKREFDAIFQTKKHPAYGYYEDFLVRLEPNRLITKAP